MSSPFLGFPSDMEHQPMQQKIVSAQSTEQRHGAQLSGLNQDGPIIEELIEVSQEVQNQIGTSRETDKPLDPFGRRSVYGELHPRCTNHTEEFEVRPPTPRTPDVQDNCLLSGENIPCDSTRILARVQPSHTQWRPNISNLDMEEINLRMTAMLKTSFDGLAEAIRNGRSTPKSSLPRFEGAEWENPKEFLQIIRRICEKDNISWEDRTTLAADQLRGEAHRWYENYRVLRLDFETFAQRLLDKYDNFEIRSQLQAKLFGQKQEQESAAIFISKKVALYRRLMPTITEEEQICNIKTLLTPEIRVSLRGARINTMDELIQLATSIETDLQELNRITRYLPQPTSRNPPSRVQPRQERHVRTTGEVRGSAIPPYPCRFCQGNHYHRDCLQRPIGEAPRHQLAIEAPSSQNSRRSGNEWGAVETREPAPQLRGRPT